ncbi:MAG TPA: hypothetical protein VJ349_02985, partial [Stellaceae bacterium]|nr:hypothetical protein [Stellaceae bacterium]
MPDDLLGHAADLDHRIEIDTGIDAHLLAIDRLIPYAKNARTHTDAQIAAIAASIKEWGWTTPALVGE